MVEPYYHKVKDFAMEFSSDGEGTLTFEGLSLFHTQNGAYTGNLLLTGREALSRLSHFVDPALLTAVRARITETLGPLLSGRYRGPVGVDMMVCSAQSGAEDSPEPRTPLLHPCVEVNLRRTMGHVALALERRLNAADDDEVSHVMRIAYSEDNYKLTITQKLKNSKT